MENLYPFKSFVVGGLRFDYQEYFGKMFSTPENTFRWIFFTLVLYSFLPRASAFTTKTVESITRPIYNTNDGRNDSRMTAMSACILKYLQNYFTDQKLTRKSIYLLTNNHENKLRAIEEKFLMAFHGMENHWLSIQLYSLNDSIEFDVFGKYNRRDFVWFLTDVHEERVIDQLLFNFDSAETAHLHLIHFERLSEEQIPTTFEILSRSCFGRNVNILMAHDVNQWAWYSHSSVRENCGREVILVEAEFHWQGDRCANAVGNRIIDPTPNKMIKENCQLKVGSIHSPPYTFYDEKKGFYKGIEYYMIETIAKKLNRDIVYKFINATEYYEMMEISDEFVDLSDG